MTIKEKIENDKLYKLLLKINKRPELFILNRDVNLLYTYILGYRMSQYENNCSENIDIFDINSDGGFDAYVHRKYKINTTHNWSSIIKFYNPTYGQDLDKFYELFFDYIDECIKKNEK